MSAGAKVQSYVSWQVYRKILVYCEREGITPYMFMKRAILHYIKTVMKEKYRTPLISHEKA